MMKFEYCVYIKEIVHIYPLYHDIHGIQTIVWQQQTCKGSLMPIKQTNKQYFTHPLFRPQKNSAPTLFIAMQVNPIEKYVNATFTVKFVVIFFKATLTRAKS